MATGVTPNIKQIQLSDNSIHDIEALHFYSSSTLDTPAQWKAYIDSIAELGFEIKKIASLPTANASAYETYHNCIVLIEDATSVTGSCTEYVIVRSGTEGSYTYAWEKVGTTSTDLSAYATKAVAGKAGSYTSSTPSTNATGSAGAETATGSVTISYKLADSATGSAGAHTHSVTGSTTYTPAGTISAVTASAHSHTVNAAKSTTTVVTAGATVTESTGSTTTINTGSAGGVTISGSNFSFSGTSATISGSITGTAVDAHEYQPAGSVSKVSAASHSHKIDSHTHATGVVALTNGSTFSANGDDTFSAGSLPSLTISDKAKVAQMSATVAVDLVKTINGGSFTQGSKASWAATVSDGVLQFSWTANGNDSFTAASVATTEKITPITVGSASGWSAGTAPSFTQGAKASFTAATASVAGAASAATLNTTSAGAIDVTPTFTGTTATLSHSVTQGSFSTSYKPAGSISGSQTVSAHSHTYSTVPAHTHAIGAGSTTAITYVTGATLDTAGGINVTPTFTGTAASITISTTAASAGGHTHSIGLTDTSVTGSVSVAVSDHTHTLGNHTHSVTVANCE